MLVVVAIFELHIPHAQSLKEKRMVVKSLRDRLRNHFQISANEVALHDVHQRTRLAVTFIADRNDSADFLLDSIQHFVETNADAMLTGWTSEKLDFDENCSLT